MVAAPAEKNTFLPDLAPGVKPCTFCYLRRIAVDTGLREARSIVNSNACDACWDRKLLESILPIRNPAGTWGESTEFGRAPESGKACWPFH